MAIQTNNVEVDDRGLIYLADRADTGLHIVALTGPLRSSGNPRRRGNCSSVPNRPVKCSSTRRCRRSSAAGARRCELVRALCGEDAYRPSLRERSASGQFRSTEIDGSTPDLVVTKLPSAATSYDGGRS